MNIDPTMVSLCHDPERGVFTARSGGMTLGTLTYAWIGEASISIDHVVVIPQARGGRIARSLVEGVLEWARGQHVAVIPVCRYAQVVIRRSFKESR